ncbi:reverse transcriptase domain-containing protein [Tanacetum coccineum]
MLIMAREEMAMVEMEMEGTIDALSRHSNHVIPRNMMVRYAASSLREALTWWNTKVQARGREAAMGMTWNEFKALLVEEFCPSNEMEKLENEFWNHKMVGANHAAYTDRFHELAKLVPHLVTLESTRIKSCGTLTKSNDKRKVVEETSKSRGSWKDNKKEKVGTRFVATAPSRNEFVGPNPNNGNQVRGRAFNVNVNAMEVIQDPNVVTGFMGNETVESPKALKSVKEDEPKLGDISIVRDFEDCVLGRTVSGLSTQRKAEFRIRLSPIL